MQTIVVLIQRRLTYLSCFILAGRMNLVGIVSWFPTVILSAVEACQKRTNQSSVRFVKTNWIGLNNNNFSIETVQNVRVWSFQWVGKMLDLTFSTKLLHVISLSGLYRKSARWQCKLIYSLRICVLTSLIWQLLHSHAPWLRQPLLKKGVCSDFEASFLAFLDEAPHLLSWWWCSCWAGALWGSLVSGIGLLFIIFADSGFLPGHDCLHWIKYSCKEDILVSLTGIKT